MKINNFVKRMILAKLKQIKKCLEEVGKRKLEGYQGRGKFSFKDRGGYEMKMILETVATADNNIRYVQSKRTADSFCGVAHESRYYWVKNNFDLKDKDVLDFGCGSGYGIKILSEKIKSIWGLDYSKTSIDYALVKYGNNKSKFLVGDACSSKIIKEFGEKKFDLIVSFDVIEHLDDYFGYLENIKSLLKKEGIAIVGCPNRLESLKWNKNWNPFHIQEFTPIQLKKLLSIYFKEVIMVSQDISNKTEKESIRKSIRGSRLKNYLRFFLRLLPKEVEILSNVVDEKFYTSSKNSLCSHLLS